MSPEQTWQQLCLRAFDNDTVANDFVLFVEGCKTSVPEGYVWTTQQPEYQQYLCDIGCTQSSPEKFILSSEALVRLSEIKKIARTEWHVHRQEQLKRHLKQTLAEIQPLSELTHPQRLALVKEFASTHKADLGSVPFISGLRGFLRYQLAHKDYLIEWPMTEYILTQNNEEALEAYVRLLKGVLCMQLVYRDETQDVTIDIDDSQEILLWRMNPDLQNNMIHDILNCLSGNNNTTSNYQKSSIPRIQHKQSLLDWIYTLLSHCLSFLKHK
jgi:hypothetical protein